MGREIDLFSVLLVSILDIPDSLQAADESEPHVIDGVEFRVGILEAVIDLVGQGGPVLVQKRILLGQVDDQIRLEQQNDVAVNQVTWKSRKFKDFLARNHWQNMTKKTISVWTYYLGIERENFCLKSS